ncbi:argininosuccinate lyase 1 [Ferrovum sp. PN-J185]|nr:argininosuccinate lyase [Ferrovum sp. PN-J185]KXW55993.1 argininosuccinate lyase 1 [Ferrovum sp. PN-J185]
MIYTLHHFIRDVIGMQKKINSAKGKTWSGRFSVPTTELVKTYTASVFFDKKLALFDIQGSLAHAQMLSEVGVLSQKDLKDIKSGMAKIKKEIETNEFNWSLDSEDVHLNIERKLTDLIGDAGKRLHTGRSRNDQVATDIRLYLRHELDNIQLYLLELLSSCATFAAEHFDTVMPGFTHLQVAQPITLGHHLHAYCEMFERDLERFEDCRKRINRLPLGSAALAGTSYPLNRQRVMELLGFEDISRNSLDAVSDRDFAIEFCSCASILMIHLSRLSEELILWMSPRFNFIEIGDAFCTGSSIMPQKKNPDVPELARGKSGRVIGHLMGLLTLMKAQPLAYNKDNQEDKEPLFDTVETVSQTLQVFRDMLADIKVNKANMEQAAKEGFATATDLADYLVKKGIPFRDAHEIVAKAVLNAEKRGVDLDGLSLDELKVYSTLINKDVYEVLTLKGSLHSRDLPGATAPKQVKKALNQTLSRIKKRLGQFQARASST